MKQIAEGGVLQMFRDFELESDEKRHRLLYMLNVGSSEREGGHRQIFIRVTSITNQQEEYDAQLA